MTDTPTFFVTNYDPNFGHYKPEDDFLHPTANAAVDNYACTETQYLGFNIPEACISGVGYMWHHPHMKTVLGGAVAYQGVKRQFIAAELCDVRSFMSDEVLKNDLHEVTFDNGYRTQVIEPGRLFRIRYDDPARKNHFDVTLTAIMPPAMWPTGRHLEQAMKPVRREQPRRGVQHLLDFLQLDRQIPPRFGRIPLAFLRHSELPKPEGFNHGL